MRRFSVEVTEDTGVSLRRDVETGETPCRGVTLGESTLDLNPFCGETLRSNLSLIFNVAILAGKLSSCV